MTMEAQQMASLPARPDRPASRPAPWDPFRELEELREQIDRLLADVGTRPGLQATAVWSPPVDLEETDDAWVVEADLPGVKKRDVTVEVRDSELAIHGEVKERERTGILRRRMRRTGQFDYRVTLPGDVDDEHIEAELHDGVLTVRIPKPARAQPRRIEVRGG
jgi:HSP20 family protein